MHDAGGGAAKNSDGFLVGCVDSFLEEGDGPAGDEGGVAERLGRSWLEQREEMKALSLAMSSVG